MMLLSRGKNKEMKTFCPAKAKLNVLIQAKDHGGAWSWGQEVTEVCTGSDHKPLVFQAALPALPMFVARREQGGSSSRGRKFDEKPSLCKQQVSSESRRRV